MDAGAKRRSTDKMSDSADGRLPCFRLQRSV